MKFLSGSLLAFAALFSLSGCASWFDSDDEDLTAPVELTSIEQTVKIKKLWSTAVGNGQGEGLYRLQPVIGGDAIYAASSDGQLRALDRGRGKTLWKADLDTSLSGGVGVYDDALLLGSSDGSVLKVSANSGELLWSTRLQGEVLAPPQGDGRVVVAQTYDGKLQGLDFDSGEKLWTYDSNVPVLTIRGTNTPILNNNTVYAGFANTHTNPKQEQAYKSGGRAAKRGHNREYNQARKNYPLAAVLIRQARNRQPHGGVEQGE